MTALASVRRRWTLAAIAAGLAAAALLVLVAVSGVDTLRTSKAGRPASTLPAGRALPPTPAGLLAIKGDGGRLTALVVVALSPPGQNGVARGGTILPLPVGAGIELGTDPKLRRLADTYAAGGLNGLVDVASSLLTVNFSVATEVDQSALAELLTPVGPLDVSVPVDVATTGLSSGPDTSAVSSDPSAISPDPSAISPDPSSVSPDPSSVSPEPTVPAVGSSTVVVRAGAQKLSVAQGAALLAADGGGFPESDRFGSEVAYWSTLAHRVGQGVGTAYGSAPSAMGRFFGSLLAGPVRVYALRGEALPSGPENPDGVDVYRLDAAEVIRVMATVLPDAVSPVDASFTVQIINPTGDSSLTQAAVERLAFGGVGIVLVRELTGLAVPRVTEVSLGGKAEQAEVKPFADSLGENAFVPLGASGTPHGRVLGVDVTFVLGESFRALVARQTPVTTTSPGTVTTVTTTDVTTTSAA